MTWRATDPETAWTMVNELYQSVKWSAGQSESFTFAQDVHLAEGVSFVRIRYGAAVEYADVESDDFIGVGHDRSGTYRYRSHGMEGDGNRLMLLPAGRIEASYHDVAFTIANFSTAYLQRVAAAQSGTDGTPRLAVRGLTPLSPSAERDLRTTIGAAFRSLDDPDGALQNDLVRAASLEALALMTLHAYPIEIPDRAGAARDDGASAATVRRALNHIEEHSHEAVTVADIAAAARLSVRGLHHAFRRATGRSPMEHLRHVRLQTARAALLSADATSGDTVAAIARAAGFGHLPRFARDYVAEFGEYPHQTLLR